MKINKNAIKKTDFNSGNVGALSYTVHQITSGGLYRATIFLKKKIVEVLEIIGDEESNATQANIDLGAINATSILKGKDAIVVAVGGYILFYNSKNDHSYTAIIELFTGTKWKKCFDSTKLKKDDLFVFMPIRPGIYTVYDPQNDCQTEVEVLYPNQKLMRRRHEMLKPCILTQNADGFAGNKKHKILPGQGVMIQSAVDFSTSINLKDATDQENPRTYFNIKKKRGAKPASRKIKWVNPQNSRKS